MTTHTISFDQFKAALREEKKAGEMAAEKLAGEASTKLPTRLQLYRNFLEQPQTQIATIFFIYLDIIAQCLLMTGDNPGPIWNVIFLFATVFFAFELLLEASLFQVRFFSHWGCLVDTVLVGLRLARGYASFEMNQQHLFLLNFLKVWRFARLLNSYISIEKQKHTILRKKLKLQIESTNDWKEKALLSEDLDEEVKTLREALKMASQDVAAAMLGKFNPDLRHLQVVMEDSSISTDD